MFKWRGLWSEYKEETLYVLAMMIVFSGVFFLISYLMVESLEQHTSPDPLARLRSGHGLFDDCTEL
jgi:hypothetical protein